MLIFCCCTIYGQNSERKKNIKSSKEVFRLDSLGKLYEASWVDSSAYYYELAVKYAARHGNAAYVAKTMNRLGFNNIYLIKDEPKAIEWLEKAILIAKRNDDFLNLAESHKLLAVVFFSQNVGNPIELIDKAAAYAQQANSW